MRILQALPRRMRFEAKASTSVELCVAEWVSGSRHRATTTVVAERSDAPPVIDVAMLRLAPAPRLSSWHLAFSLRRHIRRTGAELIVTQQHIPTAARLAMINPATPVVLQTHNFIDPPALGAGAARKNRRRLREFARLAGLTLISDAVRERFEQEWPQVTIPRAVVTNGFDFSGWHPSDMREKRIMVVGRNQPEKGILEAAQGCATFLAAHADWQASFILSEIDREPEYLAAIRAALEPAGARAEIISGIPFARVKAMTEHAALSIVASRWIEPFGRTALEAHAGGAALISSLTGGLRQISGDTAFALPEISGPAIADALAHLAGDDALRDSLARRGAARVRELFPLAAGTDVPAGRAKPVCERLDDFLELVRSGHR